MDYIMTNEIKEAIERNLPSAVGEALQKRLKQAESDAAEVQRLRSAVQEKEAKIVNLSNELKCAEDQLTKHESLDKREAAVAERERAAEITELRIKLEAAEASKAFARDVALGLVRNTEYRHSVFESQTGRAMAVPQGGMLQQTYNPESKTVTTDTKAA